MPLCKCNPIPAAFGILMFFFNPPLFAEATPFKSDKHLATPPPSLSSNQQDLLKQVGVVEHLGARVPIHELRFNDETGQDRPLSDYFVANKAVMLVLMYFRCPHLCGFMFNGLMKGLKELDYSVGKEFEVVMASIDPQETSLLAAQKKENIINDYGRTPDGWHILTGSQEMIQKLAHAVGFEYQYVAADDQYAHSAVIFLLTPEGVISRYLYGIEFKPSNLKIGLLEASSGKIGTVMDRFLLYCFQYDPSSRGYSLTIFKIMQAAGLVTVLFLLGAVGFLVARRRKEEHNI